MRDERGGSKKHNLTECTTALLRLVQELYTPIHFLKLTAWRNCDRI